MLSTLFNNQDISWLSFNERVLLEATRPYVPLQERLRFLSIFSSNLDEFFRVRMPVLHALHKIKHSHKKIRKFLVHEEDIYKKANDIIRRQSQFFGSILTNEIIPQFAEHGIHILYDQPIPAEVRQDVHNYFFDRIAGFLEIIYLDDPAVFLPENNKLFISVMLEKEDGKNEIALVRIPSDIISRFFIVTRTEIVFVVLIDDIIKSHLHFLFPERNVIGAHSIKITRDAELDLADEFEGDIAEKIEKQLSKRDFGLATRFLYPPAMPFQTIDAISERFALLSASFIEGGNYHNLKDFADLPVMNPQLVYPKFQSRHFHIDPDQSTLLREIQKKDILIHTPYQDFNTIIRFFNEAAITKEVEEIYVTLYRVANESRIAHALICAARNGKKVTVFVELKARFDESNNIRWAKKMKSAGVNIIYSIPELKVHAKLALLKLKKGGHSISLGMFSTGNFNEITAGFYTDHILLTANIHLCQESESLFLFLKERKKPKIKDEIIFRHLLVAQFNLQACFLSLIDNEITNSRKGLPAGITIKLNNLEEEVLIAKLYDASRAGVPVKVIVRGICRLIPGIHGISENISIRRIVGRFLEHGRIFIFCNDNNNLVFLGSSDWMTRNIYRRIEVCFPIYEDSLKREIKDIIQFYLDDNISAVSLDEALNNTPVEIQGTEVNAQRDIFEYLNGLNY